MGTEGEEQMWAGGGRTEAALGASLSLPALGKESECDNVLYCLVVSITLSAEEISLGQARKKKKNQT